jgi:hypothetical protein
MLNLKIVIMKHLALLLLTVLSFVFITNNGCKKQKGETTIDTSCGCNGSEIKYSLLNLQGTLSYFTSKSKWVYSFQPQPGNIANYFPCNTTQDSLRAILLYANTSQIFNVKISGKVKATCPNEDFVVTSGVTTFDYIIIDSLKRY